MQAEDVNVEVQTEGVEVEVQTEDAQVPTSDMEVQSEDIEDLSPAVAVEQEVQDTEGQQSAMQPDRAVEPEALVKRSCI